MAGMARAMSATLRGGAKIAWQRWKALCIFFWTSIYAPWQRRNKVRRHKCTGVHIFGDAKKFCPNL